MSQPSRYTQPFFRPAPNSVRLLRISPPEWYNYTIETVPLQALPRIRYQTLSHHDPQTPAAHYHQVAAVPTHSCTRAIFIDRRRVYIPPMLHDLFTILHTVFDTGSPTNLWFIPGLCLDAAANEHATYLERGTQRYLFAHACRTVAWLGNPAQSFEVPVRALGNCVRGRSGRKNVGPVDEGSKLAKKGWEYMAAHPYWRRGNTVGEVLLSDVRRMAVWCGATMVPATMFVERGRGTAAERALGWCDAMWMAPGRSVGGGRATRWEVEVGSLQAMTEALRSEGRRAEEMYRGRRELKFQTVNGLVGGLAGELECEDASERLYGLLGTVNNSLSRGHVVVEFGGGAEWAFEQALKAGLEELADEQAQNYELVMEWLSGSKEEVDWVEAYYQVARRVFGITENVGRMILMEVKENIMDSEEWGAVRRPEITKEWPIRLGVGHGEEIDEEMLEENEEDKEKGERIRSHLRSVDAAKRFWSMTKSVLFSKPVLACRGSKGEREDCDSELGPLLKGDN